MCESDIGKTSLEKMIIDGYGIQNIIPMKEFNLLILFKVPSFKTH